MRRNWTLAALPLAALVLGAAGARAATTTTKAPGSVLGVSIVPATGHAQVDIAVDGPVDLQDFTLTGPDRIVVDVSGAKLGMAPNFYDRIARGGIVNVRAAQYRDDVVRIVIELDQPHTYTIQRGDASIRLDIDGGSADFSEWHSIGGTTPPVDLTANVAATTAATAAPTPGTLHFASTQPRLTVTYQDADIRDVLAAFAAFSGRTIVVGKDVEGTITAEIRDQPWDVALNAILQAQGLAASEDVGGIITVDSYKNIASKTATEPLLTQLVAVNYAKAASLAPTIKSLLSKDCSAGAAGSGAQRDQATGCVVRGTVVADTATNTLLITEAQGRMNDILSYVHDLDVRTPQVSIKVKLVEVNRTATEQLGVSYDLTDATAHYNTLLFHGDTGTARNAPVVIFGGDALAGVSNASRTYQQGSALNLLYRVTIGRFALTSFIDALSQLQLADVQAEPTIVTLDNQEAEILVGEETPVRVVDAGGQVGSAARANVEFKETGIILKVTPHITNNRQIMMQVHAEDSKLNIVGGDLGFVFEKRRTDNQLLVNDGETAVIGGLTQTSVTKNRKAIPFLGQLPIIGRLFSETDSQEIKRDLLVLITPHIVDEQSAPGQGN